MVLDVVINKTDDGYTADIPSLKGCECWAHDEETALKKIIELAAFYLKLDSTSHLHLDKARGSCKRVIYKLVLPKS